MGLPEPDNEAQLRELGRLSDPEKRQEAYVAAVEVVGNDGGRGLTASDIRAEIDRRLDAVPARKSSKKRLTPTQRLQRASGLVEELEDALERGDDPATLLRKLRRLLVG